MVQYRVECELHYIKVPSFISSVVVALTPRVAGKFLAADNCYSVFHRILTYQTEASYYLAVDLQLLKTEEPKVNFSVISPSLQFHASTMLMH